MVKAMNSMSSLLRKCKSFSTKLGRSSSYTSLRSKSTKEDWWCDPPVAAAGGCGGGDEAAVFVGSSRRLYMIRAKHLSHPVMTALINRSPENNSGGQISVKCEVVLFDHLLWMLENGELEASVAAGDGSLEELASLYES